MRGPPPCSLLGSAPSTLTLATWATSIRCLSRSAGLKRLAIALPPPPDPLIVVDFYKSAASEGLAVPAAGVSDVLGIDGVVPVRFLGDPLCLRADHREPSALELLPFDKNSPPTSELIC